MLSATIAGACGANSYDLAAVALQAGTNYSSSAAVEGSAPSARPAAPSLTATAVSSSQINLAWNSVSGARVYAVDMLLGTTWKQIGALTGGATGCSVIGLAAATTYTFEVGAASYSGTAWSSPASATTSGGTIVAPAAPSLTATAVSASQINLAWNSVGGATSYLVDELINGSWTQITSLGSGSTSYSVSGLAAGTAYTFEVAAYNSAGTTWSTSQTATTNAAAPTPAPVTVTEPAAATAYSPVSGTLFAAGGPSYLDVHQGDVGDCWLMAGLAEVAARDPAVIQSMFTADGTTVENGATVDLYTVRFYNGAGAAEYVTVDAALPSGGAYYDQVENGVLWAALAEKAYAEANGAGIVTTQYAGSDSYNALNGGDPSWALQAITGQPASDFNVNPSSIASDWNSGELIVLGSSPRANDNLIVGDSSGTHAYAMVGYNSSSSTPFELYNPWGVSSVVNSTISYNGSQVYAGPFYANSSLISQDFAMQSIGSGADNGQQAGIEAATELLLARCSASPA